jgi:SsrA-binding protein
VGKRTTTTGTRYRDVAQNRRALHDYEIVEREEAGLVLRGSEVKALRARGATIRDAYAQLRGGEAWLVGAHISEYAEAGRDGHDSVRPRKLLLHRLEIERLGADLAQKGLSLIPLRLYFNEQGRAKVELGLGRGRAHHDKRQAIKERDARRESDRAIRAVRTR